MKKVNSKCAMFVCSVECSIQPRTLYVRIYNYVITSMSYLEGLPSKICELRGSRPPLNFVYFHITFFYESVRD